MHFRRQTFDTLGQGLGAEKSRRAEESRKGLGAQGKTVGTESRCQMSVRAMKAQVIDGASGFGFDFAGRGAHGALCMAAGTAAHYSPGASFILKHISVFLITAIGQR